MDGVPGGRLTGPMQLPPTDSSSQHMGEIVSSEGKVKEEVDKGGTGTMPDGPVASTAPLTAAAVLLAENHIESDGDDDDGNGDGDDDGGDESDTDPADTLTYASYSPRRVANPKLPDTVTLLETPGGGKVYVVGTAHFSKESQEDVAKTIELTQPDIVLLELCNNRVNILSLDEETLLREVKDLNWDKIRTAIKQSGVIQGVLHLLLLNMSAHLTEQLGMAPGGEFRKALHEAQKIPNCRVVLGDRPIEVTLKRALGSLNWWQKIRLAYYIITSKEPITKDEVERFKQKDLLEEMLREITGEFPALSKVFVEERDRYLAQSLKISAKPLPSPHDDKGFIPPVVVGVVGIGHISGIQKHWLENCNVHELLKVPPPSLTGTVLRWSVRAALLGALTYGSYRFLRLSSRVVVSSIQQAAAAIK